MDNWKNIAIPNYPNADGSAPDRPVMLGALFDSLSEPERSLMEWMFRDKSLSGTLHAMQSGSSCPVDALCERLRLKNWNPLRADDPFSTLQLVNAQVEEEEHEYQKQLKQFHRLKDVHKERLKQHKEARQLASLNAFGSSSLTEERRKHYDINWVPRAPIEPRSDNLKYLKASLLAERFHPWYGATQSTKSIGVPQLPVFSSNHVKARGASVHTGLNIDEHTLDKITSNMPVVKGLGIDRGTLGQWVREFFSSYEPHFFLFDHSHSESCRKQPYAWHLIGLESSVDVLHSVDVGSETFDSQACGRGGSRNCVLVCSAAQTTRVLADHDNIPTFRLAYPNFSIPSNNTYIEWPARVLFYIRVRYDVADCERSSSHAWADASITKHQVIGIFAVVQYYKHHPKRLSWSWGPLAELFQQDQWEMGASSLVPVSAIRGKFILGPLDSAADKDFEFEIRDVDSSHMPECMCVNRIQDNAFV